MANPVLRADDAPMASVAAVGEQATVGRRLFAFYAAVIAIQGIHVVEHIIQLIQVFALGVHEDDALGLLGYVFAFQGTEEWLHLAFNSAYLGALFILLVGLLWSPAARTIVPVAAMLAFFLFAVWLESWHVLEHAVIIGNVIANDGCPCPGILDAGLGVGDTVLHFGYNAVAYAGTIAPFIYLTRAKRT
jgi:hypothetical protein